jgi:hypothetical protein
MIVRDTQTGALHEVPESQLYEVGEMNYDGFGNPVGFNPFSAIGNLVSAPFQAVRNIVSPLAQAAGGIFQPGAQAAGNVAASFLNPIAQAMQPGGMPGMPPGMPGMPPGSPYPGSPYYGGGYPRPFSPFGRPMPPGWVRPMSPVAGANRLYLRCSSWPGPAGLAPGPGMPVGVQPGMPGMPGVPAMAPRRYRRRRR